MTSLSRKSPASSPSPEIPVQPDHFYSSENVQLPPSPHSEGKTWLDPTDDLLAARGIPVFKPTMEEFRDFEAYMNRVECWGNRSGIVKVIPPKEWTDSLPSIKDQLINVKIKSPIEQHMLGNGGRFRQENVEKRKFMTVSEWVELCGKDGFRAPSKYDVGLASRGLNVARAAAPTRSRRAKMKPAVAPEERDSAPVASSHTLIKDEPIDATATPDEEIIPSVPTPPRSEASPPPAASTNGTNKKAKAKGKKPAVKAEPKPRAKRTHQPKEVREAKEAARITQNETFLEDFDPHVEWLPPDMTTDDYSPEFCHQLERQYWRNLGMGKPAWYGADTQGSLFTDDTTSWNVAHLPSALSRLLPSSSQGLPGVNTPYLYFGMWRATFAWHVEDMDLFSINYIHFGAPKFWYAIPQGRASALEQVMRSEFPKDTSQCSQFLRHKSFLLSPSTLATNAVRPNCLVQHAGEFVITYPRGYHAGFNLGLNCAESVNFALDSWIELGRKAKACECVSDSVRIDVDQLLQEREDEKNGVVHGMEFEGEEEQNWEDPAPPVELDDVKENIQTSVSISPRKRKPTMMAPDTPPKAKKLRTHPTPSKPPIPMPVASTSRLPLAASKILPTITLKLGPRDEPFPCCLCVGYSKDDLLRVQDPPTSRKDITELAGNPKVWMAHEYCARIVPETWVDDIRLPNGSMERVVYGVDAIVKDRWNLKCSSCTKNRFKIHGAPVQCTKGKCPKAFHVNCARDGSSMGVAFSIVRTIEKEVVLLDDSRLPSSYAQHTIPHPSMYSIGPSADVMAVDNPAAMRPLTGPGQGKVLKAIHKYEVQTLCTQHNPAVAAMKKARQQDKIRSDLMALPSMSRIKIRVSAGVFEVSLIRVIEETGSVEVLWDQGTTREFKWGSVVFGNTDSPVQQKPSDLVAAVERFGSASAPVSATTSQQHQQQTYGYYAPSAYSHAPPINQQGTQVQQQTTASGVDNAVASTSASTNAGAGSSTDNAGVNMQPTLYANMQQPMTGSYRYGHWGSYTVGTSAYGATGSFSYPMTGYVSYGAPPPPPPARPPASAAAGAKPSTSTSAAAPSSSSSSQSQQQPGVYNPYTYAYGSYQPAPAAGPGQQHSWPYNLGQPSSSTNPNSIPQPNSGSSSGAAAGTAPQHSPSGSPIGSTTSQSQEQHPLPQSQSQSQPLQQLTIQDISTLVSQPDKLIEALRTNPQLQEMVLAALGPGPASGAGANPSQTE